MDQTRLGAGDGDGETRMEEGGLGWPSKMGGSTLWTTWCELHLEGQFVKCTG